MKLTFLGATQTVTGSKYLINLNSKNIFLTHGESGASEALKDKIQKKFGWAVTIPSYLDSEELK